METFKIDPCILVQCVGLGKSTPSNMASAGSIAHGGKETHTHTPTCKHYQAG